MEKQELSHYTRFLDNARTFALKQHWKTAIILGGFMGAINSVYAYSFWIGSIWIEKEFVNDIFDRVYTPGDVLVCFFGILFGLFGLAGISPCIAAVKQGQVAGKMAFTIIDRLPMIKDDAKLNKNHDLKGSIEFKNVSFYYPSRQNNKVLKNFDAEFKLGKTTAIVGPSGSGKSTVA